MIEQPAPRHSENGLLQTLKPRVVIRRRTAPNVLLVAVFAAFVTSLPFEVALTSEGGIFSISRYLGYLLFALALWQPSASFKKPPSAFWWFAAYLILYSFLGLAQPEGFEEEIFAKAFRLGQLLAVLWMGYSLLQSERVVRWSLWGFSFSCATVGLLVAIGAGVTEYHGVEGRETVFGQGPNTQGMVVALGAVTLVGMAFGRTRTHRLTKFAAWSGLLPMAAAIVRTGSRGAMVETGIGLTTLLALVGTQRARTRNIMILVGALGICLWVTILSTTTSQRWEAALEEGSMAGREVIYPTAWKMFLEKPLMGWGVTNSYELGYRLSRKRRDTHNLPLWLLTEAGLVGTVPFCIGLALCVRDAWRARKGIQGLLPLALIATSLTANLVGTYYELKLFWVVLAYATASETYLRFSGGRLRRHSMRPAVESSRRSGRGAGATVKPIVVGVNPRSSLEIGQRPVT